MNGFLWVGLGGGFGAMARYGVGKAVTYYCADHKFPLATFLVNFGGCLLIGLLAGFVEKQNLLNLHTRLFLITGFLGGFTTFSAFGLETLSLIRRGDLAVASLNVGASIVCCLIAVWLGFKLSGLGTPAA